MVFIYNICIALLNVHLTYIMYDEMMYGIWIALLDLHIIGPSFHLAISDDVKAKVSLVLEDLGKYQILCFGGPWHIRSIIAIFSVLS